MNPLFWGTFDLGKPRVRILLQGLKENGIAPTIIHKDIWGDVEDKSQVKSSKDKLVKIGRFLLAYPILICRYLFAPKHDVVVISYLGHFDVILVWLFAKARRKKIVWDAFLSLYNTVVEDRKMVSKGSIVAKLLYALEWLACRAADTIVLDTHAHGEYFVSTFNVPREKVKTAFVGAELEKFPTTSHKQASGNTAPNVLFYGQFIPLHGISVIHDAALLLRNENINWTIIGEGQMASAFAEALEKKPLSKLNWIKWVQYEELVSQIHNADICLGIFGDTEKASRVIPNKVFQIISSGVPLVTMDSPAIREIFTEPRPGVKLCKAGNAEDLAEKILQMRDELTSLTLPVNESLRDTISPLSIGKAMKRICTDTIHGKR